jgi:hypothetical protein
VRGESNQIMISLLVLLTTTITTLVLADGNITVADVTTALGLGDAQVSNVSVAGVSTPAAVPSVDVASNPGMSQQRLNISCAQGERRRACVAGVGGARGGVVASLRGRCGGSLNRESRVCVR